MDSEITFPGREAEMRFEERTVATSDLAETPAARRVRRLRFGCWTLLAGIAVFVGLELVGGHAATAWLDPLRAAALLAALGALG